MPSMKTLLYRSEGGICTLTLNQPEKRNPISPALLSDLYESLERVAHDEDVRVVVLTGAGSVFSAGGDLSALSGAAAEPPKHPTSLPQLLKKMHGLGKPIIAKVQGHALAGGLGLVVAADLVVASDAATFGTTEIRVGLWPMMITAELTRNIGRKKTLELMLTGKRIDAAEAERIGIVNQVVPAEQLDEATSQLAQKLAAQSPTAMAHGLQAFYGTQDLEFEAALAELQGGLARVLATEDAREGLMAFLQKREPVWRGR